MASGRGKYASKRPLQAVEKCNPEEADTRQTCQLPKHANLETLKKSAEKPGDQDLKPGDFQNMC